MSSSRAARPGKKEVWFNCGRYFLRTIKREDASDRWADWLNDPWTVHVLNTVPRKMQKGDIADYIKQFDQRSRLLLGIFERGTRLHVGFIRFDIDHDASEALVSAVIGEPEHRNRGGTTVVFIPALAYLFDTVGVARVRASVLDRNRLTLTYLLKLGWQKDPTPEPPIKSHTDGTLLERWSVSWTREGYLAFLQTPLGKRVMRLSTNNERVPKRGSDAERQPV
jgi:RimJ/RimL family protein N-acetyltransferase